MITPIKGVLGDNVLYRIHDLLPDVQKKKKEPDNQLYNQRSVKCLIMDSTKLT